MSPPLLNYAGVSKWVYMFITNKNPIKDVICAATVRFLYCSCRVNNDIYKSPLNFITDLPLFTEILFCNLILIIPVSPTCCIIIDQSACTARSLIKRGGHFECLCRRLQNQITTTKSRFWRNSDNLTESLSIASWTQHPGCLCIFVFPVLMAPLCCPFYCDYSVGGSIFKRFRGNNR